jgi:hypothetical protein
MRGLTWLLPPARRVWVEALLAESREVPPGRRLAWRAGAVSLIARGVLAGLLRPGTLLVALAGGLLAWSSWSGPAGSSVTVMNRVDTVATLAAVVALAVLARWVFGPVRAWWLAKLIRTGTCVAILAIAAADAAVAWFMYAVPPGGERLRLYHFQRISPPTWPSFDSVFLILLAGYWIAVLWMTSSRAQVGKASLAIGAGTGIATGVVLYLAMPLGVSFSSGGILALDPLLPGPAVLPIGILSLILMLGVPIAAGFVAGRPFRASRRPGLDPRFRQGIAIGLLANLVTAMFVTCLGTATIALSFHSAALSDWLYRGQQLPANAAYVRDLRAGIGAGAYLVISIAAPLFGLVASGISTLAGSDPGPAGEAGRERGEGQQGPPGRGRDPGPGPDARPVSPDGGGVAGTPERPLVPAR